MSDKYKLVEELRKIQDRKWEIEAELRKYLLELTESRRVFKNGDIVSVYDENDKYRCDGVVTGALIFDFFEYSEVRRFCEKRELFEERLDEVRYKVKGIKKDGSASKHNAINSNTLSGKPSEYGHYIKSKL